MAPLDSVLDIDGNRHVFDRPCALIDSRRAIAFSGAGASAGLYPLWPELIRLLIGETVKRGLANDTIVRPGSVWPLPGHSRSCGASGSGWDGRSVVRCRGGGHR